VCTNGHCGCGGQLLTATAVAPNVLILLDRSQSMVTSNVPSCSGGSCSRWNVAKRALTALTAKYQADIRFGLALFPGQSKSCNQGESSCQGVNVGVDMALSTGTMISDYMGGAGTCSLGTPITGALLDLV